MCKTENLVKTKESLGAAQRECPFNVFYGPFRLWTGGKKQKGAMIKRANEGNRDVFRCAVASRVDGS